MTIHTVTTPQEAVEAFLLDRRIYRGRGGCTEATLATYRQVLSAWLRAGAPTDGALQDVLTRLAGRVRPVTYAKYLRHLRVFFRWWETVGGGPNPLAGVQVRAPETLPRVPSRAEVEAMIRACGDDLAGKRARVILYLLASSMLRRAEVLRLRVEDVNLRERVVTVWGKGRRQATVPLGLATCQAIRAYLASRGQVRPDDLLIADEDGSPLSSLAVTRLVRRLSLRAGCPLPYGPHSLRHFGACEVLRRSGDLELCRQLLRHSSLAMTLRYARMTQTDVQARFRRVDPLGP